KVNTVCDIGAGAGFPSIPLKICFPELNITIVDSLNKRINFLNELSTELGLTGVNFVHSRAEDFGQKKENREAFDIVIERAVASTNLLSEYSLPLCKINGQFIAMKSSYEDNELNEANKEIGIIVGKVKKIKKTPKKYPRKEGTPQKSSL